MIRKHKRGDASLIIFVPLSFETTRERGIKGVR